MVGCKRCFVSVEDDCVDIYGYGLYLCRRCMNELFELEEDEYRDELRGNKILSDAIKNYHTCIIQEAIFLNKGKGK